MPRNKRNKGSNRTEISINRESHFNKGDKDNIFSNWNWLPHPNLLRDTIRLACANYYTLKTMNEIENE
jgi:hypothetical protein